MRASADGCGDADDCCKSGEDECGTGQSHGCPLCRGSLLAPCGSQIHCLPVRLKPDTTTGPASWQPRTASCEQRIWHQPCPNPTRMAPFLPPDVRPQGVCGPRDVPPSDAKCRKHVCFQPRLFKARGQHGKGQDYRTVDPSAVPVLRPAIDTPADSVRGGECPESETRCQVFRRAAPRGQGATTANIRHIQGRTNAAIGAAPPEKWRRISDSRH